MIRLLHVPHRRITSITYFPESGELRYKEGKDLKVVQFLRKDNPSLWERIDETRGGDPLPVEEFHRLCKHDFR